MKKYFRILFIDNKVTIIQVSDDLVKYSENLSGEVNELMIKLSIELF